jgi:hypothetical protein
LPRTSHWTATAWENAGWECRDVIHHVFGSGFPKSLDVGKAIDRHFGAERGNNPDLRNGPNTNPLTKGNGMHDGFPNQGKLMDIDCGPVTPEAAQWAGWQTALKPAVENWILLRRPLSEKTVAANVLMHGTGALNIDACRVPGIDPANERRLGKSYGDVASDTFGQVKHAVVGGNTLGRWPANLMHDGSDEVLDLFPQSKGNRGGDRWIDRGATQGASNGGTQGGYNLKGGTIQAYGDSGSAARYFAEFKRLVYCAKASKRERDMGLEDMPLVRSGGMQATLDGSMLTGSGNERTTRRANVHPCVKPLALMRYLCKLITPPGGLILDPFMGSGSTGVAALQEGFQFIGIELSPEYAAIAERRIAHRPAA